MSKECRIDCEKTNKVNEIVLMLKIIELYITKGQYVHCNRFNGYLGNGKYYSKSKNPVNAAKNFIQSDCDVALAKSTKCLADYGSKPYCSTTNTTTAGKCSKNIVSHSQFYHKHTGWFSPSK